MNYREPYIAVPYMLLSKERTGFLFICPSLWAIICRSLFRGKKKKTFSYTVFN